MTHVPVLLRAIVSLDGDTLVLHQGDKPYVVSPAGIVDLSSQPLSARAFEVLLTELLPPASRQTLRSTGSAHWELPPAPELPAGRFVVVAARLSGTYWIEVRRYQNAARSRPDTNPRMADDLRLPTAEELWPDQPRRAAAGQR